MRVNRERNSEEYNRNEKDRVRVKGERTREEKKRNEKERDVS